MEKCKYFELDSEYMTYSFMKDVKKVKGRSFFSSVNCKDDCKQPKSNTDSKQKQLLICDYEIGSWIKSDYYGIGNLVEVYPGKVVIDFQGKQRTFIYPDAFDNCQLFLSYAPMKMEDEEMILEPDTDVNTRDETINEGSINSDSSIKPVSKTKVNNSLNDKVQLSDRENDDEVNECKDMSQKSNDVSTVETYSQGKTVLTFTKGIRWIKQLFGK